MTELELVPVLAERLPSIVDLPPIGAGPPTPEGIAAFDAFGAPVDGYVPPAVDIVDAIAPGPHGDVPVRIYRPLTGQVRRGVVWAHGGAFMFGDLDAPESDVVSRELASHDDIVVVAVDYRLCLGGVHFPVPHDDLHAAFVWSATEAALLPPGAPWSIGGASAGANLAAGVAQRLRDEAVDRPETVVPDSVVLAYPVLHDPLPDGSAEHRARVAALPAVLQFPPEARGFINRNFLGDNDSDVPYAFAGNDDVGGYPRTRVIVCEYDDLAPSGERFAEQLGDAGVEVEFEFVRGVAHGHLNVQGLPEALRSIEGIAGFLTHQDAAPSE